VRPPKLAIKAALGALIAVVILGLGAVSAMAAPNPGLGSTQTTTASPFSSEARLVDGPQTADVPTLAWVGESVKLVACDPAITPNPFEAPETANFNVKAWSGFALTPFGQVTPEPTFDGGSGSNDIFTNTGNSTNFFWPTSSENEGKGCVSVDLESDYPGLAQIKLDVTNADCPCGNGTYQGYSEDFYVIWMTAEAPTLSEATVTPSTVADTNSLSNPGSPGTDAPDTSFSQLTTAGQSAATTFLGDVTTVNVFDPSDWNFECSHSCPGTSGSVNNGLIDIRVKGTFPVNTGLFPTLASSYVLPDDWAALADQLAESSLTNQTVEPDLWDIHGGPTNADTHVQLAASGVTSTPCPADTFGATFDSPFDAVNNCTGTPYNFSRVFGDVTYGPSATIGPYDDEFPNETLLSDGHLNSDDAPMPALPITVSIAGNSCTTAAGCVPGDISGVGGLYSVAKALIYSHNFDGDTITGETTPGDLYNPYYGEYIPSTSRPYTESSGVDGVYDGGNPASSGDDFPGFSNGNTSPYTFWQALDESTVDSSTANTDCLRRTDGDDDGYEYGYPGDPLFGPQYYQTPDYPTSVTVYTDERGEAYVDYNPGNGFYLNNLIAPFYTGTGSISLDNDSPPACNLQGLLGDPIGTSVISAQPQYPYEGGPIGVPPAGANTITKTVDSEWSKTLTSYGKNVTGDDGTIFVAKATDINGQSFEDEEVCFAVDAPGDIVTDFTGQVGGTTLPPVDATPLGADGYPYHPYSPNDGPWCELTGLNGEAAIAVVGSPDVVQVTAYFVDEGIYVTLENQTVGTGGSTTATAPTVIPYVAVAKLSSAGNAGSAGGAGSSSASAGTGGGSNAAPLSVSKKVENVCKVDSYRISHARRLYSVRLKLSCTVSDSKTSVTFREFQRNGKLMHSVLKTVRSGRFVTVKLGTKKFARLTISL
jgi:hypothetical protein